MKCDYAECEFGIKSVFFILSAKLSAILIRLGDIVKRFMYITNKI